MRCRAQGRREWLVDDDHEISEPTQASRSPGQKAIGSSMEWMMNPSGIGYFPFNNPQVEFSSSSLL